MTRKEVIGDATLYCADMLAVLPTLAADSIDGCVTDPPYHLTSIVKRFGAEGAAPAKVKETGAYARASAGFMGKKWDGGDIAFRPETWAEVYRVLKPGAHVLAFGGDRTFHRLVTAIEDAGFEIRGTLLYLFGSGFPKSHNIGKKLDATNQRCSCPADLRSVRQGMDAAHPVSSRAEQDLFQGMRGGSGEPGNDGNAAGHSFSALRDVRHLGASPAIPSAARGSDVLQQFMPVEDVRRPAEAVRGQHEGANTAGAVWTGQSGVEGRGDAQASEGELYRRPLCESARLGAADGPQGRVHNGAPSRNGEHVRLPADPAGVREPRGPQSSEQPSEQSDAVSDERGSQAWGGWQVCGRCSKPIIPEGIGTALKPAAEFICLARKPLSGKTIAANVLMHGTGAINVDGCRVFGAEEAQQRQGEPSQETRYTEEGGTNFAAQPGRRYKVRRMKPGATLERTGGNWRPDDGPMYEGELKPGRWPANVIHDGSDEVVEAFPEAPGQMAAVRPDSGKGQKTDNIYGAFGANSNHELRNDSGSAARFFYTAKADAADRLGSKHPTVKPVDLMRWLVRLICPPGGTILDPFAGTGTTGMACLAEGFKAVLIEREAEYFADIINRMKHVHGTDTPLFDPAADGRANYLEALAEIRRRKVEAGEIQPTEQERQLLGEA